MYCASKKVNIEVVIVLVDRQITLMNFEKYYYYYFQKYVIFKNFQSEKKVTDHL